MWRDPIVDEVHAIRERLLAQFGGDLHKFCEHVRALPTKDLAAPVEPAVVMPNTTVRDASMGLNKGLRAE